jgi:hypothetical protein
MFCSSMTYCQYRVKQGIENEVTGIKEDFSLHTSIPYLQYIIEEVWVLVKQPIHCQHSWLQGI